MTVIPEMWELMERSFSGEDPPFDLVGVDDLLLIQAARSGHVEPIDELIAADGYSLGDFPPAALDALSDGGQIWGLPYCFVSNVLIYRADLFEKHGIAVPQTLDELTAAAVSVQEAERAPGTTTSTASPSAAHPTAASISGSSARRGGRRSAHAGLTMRAGRRWRPRS